jgi:hypothetical protein
MQALLLDENAALKKELIQVKAQLRQETKASQSHDGSSENCGLRLQVIALVCEAQASVCLAECGCGWFRSIR